MAKPAKTNHRRIEKKEYPLCPNCGHAMVWSFAFKYCEWVCLPCDVATGMFNSYEKALRSVRTMDAKKRKWSEELSVIGRRWGGGECAIEGCKKGSCHLCQKAANKNYKFRYWKSRKTE